MPRLSDKEKNWFFSFIITLSTTAHAQFTEMWQTAEHARQFPDVRSSSPLVPQVWRQASRTDEGQSISLQRIFFFRRDSDLVLQEPKSVPLLLLASQGMIKSTLTVLDQKP